MNVGRGSGLWNAKLALGLGQERKDSESETMRRAVPLGGYIASESRWTGLAKWLLFMISCISLVIRFYKLDSPPAVVFDELNTGEEINHYLKQEFFFDYSPPFGVILFAGMAWLVGYDGDFPFEYIGQTYYSEKMHGGGFFMSLRALSAFFGAWVPSIVFALLINIGVNENAALFASSLILFDNASCMQSRFILHDGMYYLWVVGIAFSWIQSQKNQRSSTSKGLGWVFLGSALTGFAMSTKFVGWSVYVFLMGALLKEFFFDKKRSRKTISYVAWTIVPLLIYSAVFVVHLSILTNSGPGDAHMSPFFKSTLQKRCHTGTTKRDPVSLSYMSDRIVLQNQAEPIRLHSHKHYYPLYHDDGKISSQGQQVTGYPSKEPIDGHFDVWILEKASDQICEKILQGSIDLSKDLFNVGEMIELPSSNDQPPRKIHSGDLVLLKHAYTETYLLAHDVASPLTKTNMEVTAFGLDEIQESELKNILWRIEVEGSESRPIHTSEPFSLVHMKTGVRLNNHRQNLPAWGFHQREINGAKDYKDVSTKWVALLEKDLKADEKAEHDSDKNDSYTGIQYLWVLMLKFLELQKLVLATQWSLLVGDMTHPFSSNPLSWPIFSRGVSMWDNLDIKQQIYLLPNPIAWWIAFSGGVCYFMVRYLKSWLAKRKNWLIYSEYETYQLETSGSFLFGLYLANYLPYVLILAFRSFLSILNVGNGSINANGLLFVHYYIPCFALSCCTFGLAINSWSSKQSMNSVLLFGVLIALVLSFVHFAPLTIQPSSLNISEAYLRQWLPWWDFAVISNH